MSQRVTFLATDTVEEVLLKLKKTGFYGGSIGEVAERLVCRQIQSMDLSKLPELEDEDWGYQ